MDFLRETDNSPARPRRAILVITLSFLLAAGIILVSALGNTTAAPEASQTQTATGTAATTDTVAATYSLATTSGNLLIAVVGTDDTATINAPAGWSTAINQSGTPSQAIFYKIADGTETTITATTADTEGSLGIHIYEYQYAAAVDSTNSNSGTGTALSTNSVTTSEDDQLVFSAFTTNASSSFGSWAAGFSEQNDFNTASATYGAATDTTNTDTDSLNATATSASADWIGQIVSFSSNVPTGSFNSASQIADGSGNADISVEIDHFDDEDTRLKVAYESDSDGACDGPWADATLVGPAAADFEDTGGAPDIDDGAEYQIGSGAGTAVITSSGSNTITFDWDSDTDVGAVDGTQCLRLTSNDTWQDQSTAATITLDIDNITPSISSAAISPDSGKVHFQEDVTITIELSETGLGVDTCTVNSVDVSSTLVDNGDDTYTLTYSFLPGHTTFLNGALPISCVFEDSGGNSVTATTWTDGNILASKSTYPPNPGATIPQFESFTISPETCTTTPTVTLNFTGKNIASFLVSNNAFFNGAEWEPVQGNNSWTKEWTLADESSSGEKTVYTMVRSGSLNKSLPLTAVVTLDLEDNCEETQESSEDAQESVEELVDETEVEEVTNEEEETTEVLADETEETTDETEELTEEVQDEITESAEETLEDEETPETTTPTSEPTPPASGGSPSAGGNASTTPFTSEDSVTDSDENTEVPTDAAGFTAPNEPTETQEYKGALGGTPSGTTAGVLASEAFFGNVATGSSGRWLLLVQILGISTTVLLIAVFGRQVNQKRKVAQAKTKRRKTTKKK